MSISEIQKKTFDEFYKDNKNNDDRMYALIRKYLSKKKGKGKILDVGAGTGDLLLSLENTLFEKYAIDISETAVKILKKNKIKSVLLDVSENPLPYEDNTLDVVVTTEVLEHIVNPEFLIQEAYRVLKPGGLYIASVPNIYQLSTLILFFLDIPPVNAARYGSIHFRDFTKKIFKKALKEHGFELQKMQGDIIFPFKGPVSRWIAGWWPRISHRLLAFCVKPEKNSE